MVTQIITFITREDGVVVLVYHKIGNGVVETVNGICSGRRIGIKDMLVHHLNYHHMFQLRCGTSQEFLVLH
jgi:hypothetical protein